MDANGWIKLYRQMLMSESVRALTPAQRWFWVGLLIIANRGHRSPSLRGCLAHDDGRPYSHREIADALGVALGAVPRYLRRLAELGMVQSRANGVVHIVNYDRYQGTAEAGSVHLVNAPCCVHEVNAEGQKISNDAGSREPTSVHEMNTCSSGERDASSTVHEMNAARRVHEVNAEAQKASNDAASGDADRVHEMNTCSSGERDGRDSVHDVNAGVHQMNGSVHQVNASVHQMNAPCVHEMNAERREASIHAGSGGSSCVHEVNAYMEKYGEVGEEGEKPPPPLPPSSKQRRRQTPVDQNRESQTTSKPLTEQAVDVLCMGYEEHRLTAEMLVQNATAAYSAEVIYQAALETHARFSSQKTSWSRRAAFFMSKLPYAAGRFKEARASPRAVSATLLRGPLPPSSPEEWREVEQNGGFFEYARRKARSSGNAAGLSGGSGEDTPQPERLEIGE